MSQSDEISPETHRSQIGPRQFKKDAAEHLGLGQGADEGEERAAIVRKIARQMHTVGVDGTPEHLSTSELLLLKLRNLAVTGNTRAIRVYTKYIEAYAPQISDKALG